jgi:hypothetical protein
VSEFTLRDGALEEFASAADGVAGRLAPLDPSAPLTEAVGAVPQTATADAAAELAITLTVSCQALADAVTELAGSARASAAEYARADGASSTRLHATGVLP